MSEQEKNMTAKEVLDTLTPKEEKTLVEYLHKSAEDQNTHEKNMEELLKSSPTKNKP